MAADELHPAGTRARLERMQATINELEAERGEMNAALRGELDTIKALREGVRVAASAEVQAAMEAMRVRAEKAEADAAAMRAELQFWADSWDHESEDCEQYAGDSDPNMSEDPNPDECGKCSVQLALSSSAGAALLERLANAEADAVGTPNMALRVERDSLRAELEKSEARYRYSEELREDMARSLSSGVGAEIRLREVRDLRADLARQRAIVTDLEQCLSRCRDEWWSEVERLKAGLADARKCLASMDVAPRATGHAEFYARLDALLAAPAKEGKP